MSINRWKELQDKLTIQSRNIENFIAKCNDIILPLMYNYDYTGCTTFIWRNRDDTLEKVYLDIDFLKNGKYNWYIQINKDKFGTKGVSCSSLSEELFDYLNKYFKA